MGCGCERERKILSRMTLKVLARVTTKMEPPFLKKEVVVFGRRRCRERRYITAQIALQTDAQGGILRCSWI